ncbi:hypothetical protein Ocin01_18368 [Orchesella cincta]|uniref:Uncharacterized protein n=1 Tax=Orchesella cincta TaxID=48709 RepID=A0A1D2M5X4_ORCCI|nr:hypothetical protein Ocin01_18368 [Orchesella cincta]
MSRQIGIVKKVRIKRFSAPDKQLSQVPDWTSQTDHAHSRMKSRRQSQSRIQNSESRQSLVSLAAPPQWIINFCKSLPLEEHSNPVAGGIGFKHRSLIFTITTNGSLSVGTYFSSFLATTSEWMPYGLQIQRRSRPNSNSSISLNQWLRKKTGLNPQRARLLNLIFIQAASWKQVQKDTKAVVCEVGWCEATPACL